jgi:hypothetical protein
MISKFKPEAEFYTDERCYIVEMHSRVEDESCSIVRARVAPGVTTKFHALRGIIERYVSALSPRSLEAQTRGKPSNSSNSNDQEEGYR